MKLLTGSEYEEFLVAKKNLEKLKTLQTWELDLQNQEKQLEHNKKQMHETFELNEKKAVSAMEDKLSKKINELTDFHQKEINEIRAKHQRELVDVERRAQEKANKRLEKMMEENYKKLSDSMAKLHEEGNAQTKFVQDLAKDMVKSVGSSLPLNQHKLQIEENKTVVTKGK